MSFPKHQKRGFTLLEVMISLAILAVALVAISDLNGGAVQMHAYSRRATEATLLLRGKMLDVEDDLQKNGFSDFNDEKHGDFSEDGSPDYAWSAEILKPDVQLDATQMLNLISGGGGSGGSGGGLGGAVSGLSAALGGGSSGGPTTQQPGGASSLTSGPLGGAISGQMTTFIETLKKSVREVRLSVSWQDGKTRNQVEASQIIVILPEQVGAAGQAATDAAAAAAAATPTTLNGNPVPTTTPVATPVNPRSAQ
jgi:general secretion pathway protein I